MVESALQILSHDSKIVDCVRIEVTVYRASHFVVFKSVYNSMELKEKCDY